MLVSELIEKLQEFESEVEVYVADEEGLWTPQNITLVKDNDSTIVKIGIITE